MLSPFLLPEKKADGEGFISIPLVSEEYYVPPIYDL